MLRAALIDVGGTLWPDRWPPETQRLLVRRLQDHFGLTPPAIDRFLKGVDQRDPALARPLPMTQDSKRMVSEALDAAGVDELDPDDVLDALDVPARGVIDLFPGAHQLLAAIKDLGLRTVIFSNATFRGAAGYRRDFDDLSVGHFMDDIISSFDIGYRKPSREMFDAAQRAADCAPPECIVIGDSEEKDIEPAQRLGMRAVLVALEGPPPVATRADAVATSLQEVAILLEGWTTPRGP